jgi:hypothetical protein
LSRKTDFKSKSIQINASYIEEPLLSFANENLHPDPKVGLSAFGPSSLNKPGKHPPCINVGIIGTGLTIENSRKWISVALKGFPGTEDDLDFPGCSENAGYFTRIVFDDNWVEELSHNEVSSVLSLSSKKSKFLACLELIEAKIKLLAQKDFPPTCVVIALPDDLYFACRSVNYRIPKCGQVTRNFRCAFKAQVMKYGIPTQILLEDTIDQSRDPDLPAKKAWNFFTALYFKAGGVPWSPHALAAGTCYIGISFFRPYDESPHVKTSIVQAFDETGESLVLRGPEFEWNELQHGPTPHLTAENAHQLVTYVLARYEQEVKRTPRRVVIHKTSMFDPAERDGFGQALRNLALFDFVAMRPTSEIRLIRAGTRPPLRGTCFSVGNLDFLYTTGYIDCLQVFPAMHVPAPMIIRDHVGYDTPREKLLWEILALTKMNWNSARFGGLWPITLKFSKAVAEILRELKEGEPRPQFKFYR